jgi:hypothetical protein
MSILGGKSSKVPSMLIAQIDNLFKLTMDLKVSTKPNHLSFMEYLVKAISTYRRKFIIRDKKRSQFFVVS